MVPTTLLVLLWWSILKGPSDAHRQAYEIRQGSRCRSSIFFGDISPAVVKTIVAWSLSSSFLGSLDSGSRAVCKLDLFSRAPDLCMYLLSVCRGTWKRREASENDDPFTKAAMAGHRCSLMYVLFLCNRFSFCKIESFGLIFVWT